ncbi:fimbrial biogenesis chaperone [Proteus hauseri]|nr:molecular chaperone [Proteus hauseri]
MKSIIRTYFILMLIFFTHLTYASVVLERTRLIFSSDNQMVSLQVFNHSEQPALIQSWIDEGNIESTPETTSAPFLVIPPIAKIIANDGLQIKIKQFENQLPQDRESVFYLNVLDIAPKSSNKLNQNTLQLALQTRIKLFYRPIQIDIKPDEIVDGIKINQQGINLEISNPSAYFFTISKIYAEDKEDKPFVGATMIAPFSKQQIQYQGAITPNQLVTIIYIDDDGNYLQSKKNIN